jgi:hypothetical protein
MKIIDVHSHWGTKRGYPLQTSAELEQQKQTWNTQVNYHSEAEMAQYFRDSNVQTILDFGFSKFLPPEKMQALHDYGFETEAAHRDVILGHWIHIDPRSGEAGLHELRRCIDKRIGFLGYGVSASLSPPSSDRLYDPFYKLCIEAKIPVLIFVGTTGLGAGLPGGGAVTAIRAISTRSPPRIPSSRSSPRVRAGPGRPRRSRCSCTSATFGTSCTVGRRNITRPICAMRFRADSSIASCSAQIIHCSATSG